MLQEYWASTIIFIGIFSQCTIRKINILQYQKILNIFDVQIISKK